MQKEQGECSLYIPTDKTEGSETAPFVLGVCLLECRGVRKHVGAYLQHVFRDSTFKEVCRICKMASPSEFEAPISGRLPSALSYLIVLLTR